MMAEGRHEHLDAAVIADLDAGVLDPARTKAAEGHVRSCLVCQGVRRDLAELPSLLAAVPAPAIPAEVAARLDAAIERAAQQRDREHTATVTALSSRRRRYLLPLAAAAAVVAAVGFLIPELNLEPNSAEDAATAGDAPTFAEGGAAGGTDDESAGDLAELSSDSFGGDVAIEVYKRSAALGDTHATSARDERLFAFLDRSGCAPSPTTTGARLRSVLLDGQRASLLTYGPLSRRVAVAYTCADGRPVVQARAVLDLR